MTDRQPTPWEKFKRKYDVGPWSLLDPNEPRLSKDKVEARLDICNSCPSLMQTTRICKKCGCYMPAKVTLANAECPIGKWLKEPVEEKTNE